MDETGPKDDELDDEKIVEPSVTEPIDPPEIPPTEEPKERAGAVLKRERESKGLSLDIVHESTKIPMDALRAIEEGYTIRMLSPFYYSGFVKMYARYLDIDASEIMDDYKQEELPKHIEQPDVEEFETPQWVTNMFTRERKQQYIVAIGIILALFITFKLVGLFIFKKPEPVTNKNAGKTAVVEKEVAAIVPVKQKIMKTAEEPRKKVRQETPKIVVPKEVPKVVPPSIPEPIKPKASPPPVVAVEKEVNLTVRANQNSWLRVKADGKVVFQSTLRRGTVETWLADSEIEISGRNINQLEFELNGKMIGTLGRKDRNAKKVVITKRGLSVKQ